MRSYFLEINKLRHIIYDTAAKLKKGNALVMGELIPTSFFSLIDRIERRKLEMLSQKQSPIMCKEEFHAMVKENARLCKKDIEDPLDVRDATVFLRERGKYETSRTSAATTTVYLPLEFNFIWNSIGNILITKN